MTKAIQQFHADEEGNIVELIGTEHDEFTVRRHHNQRIFSVKLRSGRTMLVRRSGPSRSKYLHSEIPARGSRAQCPLEILDMWMNKDTGEAVQLLEQTAGGKVIYAFADKLDEPHEMPDNEFFSKHREPTVEEIDKASGKAPKEGGKK